MAFQLKKMRYEDLDIIYSPKMAEEVVSATRKKRDSWPVDMHRASWSVDLSRLAFLMPLPINKEESLWRYLLGTPYGVLLLDNVGYCEFKVGYISPRARSHIDDVKKMAQEAFAVSGLLMNGAVDPADGMAVTRVTLAGF